MQSTRIGTRLLAIALLVTPGLLVAEESGSDEAIIGAVPMLSLWSGSYSASAIALSPASIPFPNFEPPSQSGLTTRFLDNISEHLVQESRRRDPIGNSRAFLSTEWGYDDTHLEILRSERAEDLLTEALDEYLEEQVDRALHHVPGLRQANAFVERVENVDLIPKKRRSQQPADGAARRLSRFDGDVQVRVDLNPRVRLKGRWGGLTGQIDLPLVDDALRVRVRHQLHQGVSAQLESRVSYGGDQDDWTTLMLSIGF